MKASNVPNVQKFRRLMARTKFLSSKFYMYERLGPSDDPKSEEIETAINDLISALEDYYGPKVLDDMYWKIKEI